MERRLLFCNIGWMRNYRGHTENDQILGGGKYVRIMGRGHEACNFLPVRNDVYGYVQPVGKQIKIEKLGAQKTDVSIQDIDVVFTAPRPGGGTVVVGWYKHATVFRTPRDIIKASHVHQSNAINTFRITTTATNAVLLPPNRRTLIVPRGIKGGIGNSNVWFAEHADKSWLASVHKLLNNPQKGNSDSRTRSRPDHFNNARVEQAAMSFVWNQHHENGYEMRDVSKENYGWDLEATSGKLTLRIEVKGLSGETPNVELTPNEYKTFQEKSHYYRLCIVTNALHEKPELTTCFFNPVSDEWEVESTQGTRKIDIKKRVAATIRIK
jgi:hypothetical protein